MRTPCKSATRPCPCGYLGHPNGRCRCGTGLITQYRSRISGPILDRIDLHVTMPAIQVDDLSRARPGESSSIVRARVARAHERQLARQGRLNARLEGDDLVRHAAPDPKAARVMREAAAKQQLSARTHHRVLRVARTLADLEGSDAIRERHVAEALAYREPAQPP